ncbi:hypothetical protein C8R46DRAFT_1035518 [Mycena filopes]|nr:hypothetical protein C8R46DRAFT_1035518 [Mycena filopes]
MLEVNKLFKEVYDVLGDVHPLVYMIPAASSCEPLCASRKFKPHRTRLTVLPVLLLLVYGTHLRAEDPVRFGDRTWKESTELLSSGWAAIEFVRLKNPLGAHRDLPRELFGSPAGVRRQRGSNVKLMPTFLVSAGGSEAGEPASEGGKEGERKRFKALGREDRLRGRNQTLLLVYRCASVRVSAIIRGKPCWTR